jgi:hypothetical protein
VILQRVMGSAAGGQQRTVTKVDPNKANEGDVKKKMIDTQPPRGTRDFMPDDMRLRNWLFNHFRQVRCGEAGWMGWPHEQRPRSTPPPAAASGSSRSPVEPYHCWVPQSHDRSPACGGCLLSVLPIRSVSRQALSIH